jgi:AcrR family transcriptional regulator
MEQIAERAEIGSTTLYRYFPGKDLLILDPFRRSMDLAAALRERPADEPLNIALGAVIHQSVAEVDQEDRVAAIRRIVDDAPVPRARLWDLAAQARSDLQQAIAERMDRAAGDLPVVLTTHLTFAVLQIVDDDGPPGRRHAARSAFADEVLRDLAAAEFVLPALAPPPGAARGRKPSSRRRQ